MEQVAFDLPPRRIDGMERAGGEIPSWQNDRVEKVEDTSARM